jgi:hypothetical protein
MRLFDCLRETAKTRQRTPPMLTVEKPLERSDRGECGAIDDFTTSRLCDQI